MSYDTESKGWNIAALAQCVDCEWIFETVLHRPAVGHAGKHAKKYGHKVMVQLVSNVTIQPAGRGWGVEAE